MRRSAVTVRVVGALGVLAASVSAPCYAAELKELQQQWWQWVMSIPASHNPIFDKNGNRCGLSQRGDVWFLAGSTGGKVTRQCDIPAGVSLFVPIVNTFCFPDAVFSDAFCVQDTDDFIDSYATGSVSLQVDGTAATPIDVRDETDFNFAVDSNGIFGAKPGIYRATIARGYWGLIGPLAPGAHRVEFQATGPLFSLAVAYDLDVVAPTN